MERYFFLNQKLFCSYCLTFITFQIFLFSNCTSQQVKEVAAKQVLERIAGPEVAGKFDFVLLKPDQPTDWYSISVKNNRVHVEGSSEVALCRGAYEYLRNECGSIVSWSGNRINLPSKLPEIKKEVVSPFKYHYYFNSVTSGYSSPYWDWDRWEREIDWMALHGLDMPLIPGAHEAILYRVFLNMGLTNEEALNYFSGPAHFPWNRMGNIGGWDGPPPTSFFQKQIDLTHKMLDRMSNLGMHPIVPAFAGFVPKGIKRLYPQEELRELGWGGFEDRVHILAPTSELFLKLGKMYISEWEKEFGKGQFYLADSFNEMDVPLTDEPQQALEELAKFGQAVYRPIAEANPEAVWVMQGWTFPYHRDENGELFWTPERLNAMMSKIPDDKLLILDMANEYNALFWKIDYSWKMYDGFFGKQWIYSFIPNMGGKVPLNGVLDYYAKAPAEALAFQNKKNLVGFGFAPEGIENNEIIYELLSDWGWTDSPIDLDRWVANYCKARYGGYSDKMKASYDLLRKSSLGTFTDHPRFGYQFRPESGKPTVHKSSEFNEAVKLFLACAEELSDEPLYRIDAIELSAQYLGLRVDEILKKAGEEKNKIESYRLYEEAINLMSKLDRLLAAHPNHKLSNWVNMARNYGDSPPEKLYYESNAKRLITTWGGGVNEYSARTWNGLIGGYYAQRWKLWLEAQKAEEKFDLLAWEENWIQTPWIEKVKPFENPLKMAIELVNGQ